MSEPKTYTLPDEPEGPLWDFYGERWDKSPAHGLWCGPDAKKRHWGDVLWFHGPLTSTPPWKPKVGGTVETEAQYAAMPDGSIVSGSSANPYVRGGGSDGDYWFGIGCGDKLSNLYMAYLSRTILRVGWSL